MENEMEGLRITDGEDEAWFYHQMDIDRVIKGESWTFNNHFMIFHWLDVDEDP
ncbi:hypothetical protein Goari_016647, partial [Gossypium aridum]|nr:hypothetical protein [Gossypium aridum]